MDRASFAQIYNQGGFRGEMIPFQDYAACNSGEETKKRKAFTIAVFEQILLNKGISIRFNEISRTIQISGVSPKYSQESLATKLPIILNDELKSEYVCSKDLIADLIGVIADKNRFNPVKDLFEAIVWDGVDRTPELYNILHIDESDSLSRILIFKWLCQSVALAYNEIEDAYGADGLLVLQGPQGIGKTSFVKALGMGPDLVKLGQFIDTHDKDTSRRCATTWICELGEIETTLRSDLERLKGFITAERDEYRLPYDRADTIAARRTSFIATCNSTAFLIDPTGSRRFWTIPLEKIDLEALKALNVPQLWAQVKTYVDVDRQCFRLTRDEQTQLAVRNGVHEKPLKAQPEVEDILTRVAQDETCYVWRDCTVSDFKEQYPSLRNYSVEQIGRALNRLNYTSRPKKVNGKTIYTRNLPFPRYWGQR